MLKARRAGSHAAISPTATSSSVTVSTGVPRIKIRLVAYSDHTNNGSRNHVSPGARMRWMVTMKLRPVRIDEKPTTSTPTAVKITWLVEACVL